MVYSQDNLQNKTKSDLSNISDDLSNNSLIHSNQSDNVNQKVLGGQNLNLIRRRPASLRFHSSPYNKDSCDVSGYSNANLLNKVDDCINIEARYRSDISRRCNSIVEIDKSEVSYSAPPLANRGFSLPQTVINPTAVMNPALHASSQHLLVNFEVCNSFYLSFDFFFIMLNFLKIAFV